jgi:hypothetical protein
MQAPMRARLSPAAAALRRAAPRASASASASLPALRAGCLRGGAQLPAARSARLRRAPAPPRAASDAPPPPPSPEPKKDGDAPPAKKETLMEKTTKDLVRSQYDEAYAKKVLAKLKELNVEDPVALQKLFVRRGLTKLYPRAVRPFCVCVAHGCGVCAAPVC